MERPTTLADALEAFDAQAATVAGLQNEMAAFNELAAQHSAILADRDALSAEVELLKKANAEYQNQLANAAQASETMESIANQKAVEALASVSVDIVAIQQEPSNSVQESAREKLSKITDPVARAKFRAANMEDLLKNR
jgi:beta-galactosidase GanA